MSSSQLTKSYFFRGVETTNQSHSFQEDFNGENISKWAIIHFPWSKWDQFTGDLTVAESKNFFQTQSYHLGIVDTVEYYISIHIQTRIH